MNDRPLTGSELQALRATMPWGAVADASGQIHVIDRNGHEVPLVEMIKLICSVSRRMATDPV